MLMRVCQLSGAMLRERHMQKAVSQTGIGTTSYSYSCPKSFRSMSVGRVHVDFDFLSHTSSSALRVEPQSVCVYPVATLDASEQNLLEYMDTDHESPCACIRYRRVL